MIRCKRLYASAKLPTRAHANDAGLDLYCHSADFYGNAWHIGIGCAVEIPPGFVGLICPRSSMSRAGFRTDAGVIDSGYSGEIRVKIGTEEHNENTMIVGAKIAQLVIVPCLLGDVVEEDFAGGERGANGFGSTGR